MCVIMADSKIANMTRNCWCAHGSRAARARPRDATWVADGHFSRQWAPVSPVTGKLDAYRWIQPTEELTGPIEEPPPAFEPPAPLAVEAAPEPAETPAEVEAAPAAQPAAPAEILPPEPKPDVKAEADRKAVSPQPVIFPLPAAPDDPGPKREQEETRLY